MDGDEFAIWQAWATYHMPLDSSWDQMAMLGSLIIAPHTPRGYQLNPKDLIPVLKSPQAQTQIDDTLEAIKRDLESKS